MKSEGTVTPDEVARLVSVAGQDFRVRTTPARGPVLDGVFRMEKLSCGLVLHATDGITMRDLDSEMQHHGGITLYLFLAGEVDLSIAGEPMRVGRHGPELEAVMISHPQPELFRRRARKGERQRKVNISFSREWLEQRGLLEAGDDGPLSRFCGAHLAQLRWRPSPRLVALAEDVLFIITHATCAEALYLESRATEMVAEAVTALVMQEAGEDGLAALDRQRLTRACAFLERRLDHLPALEEVAGDAGVSIATLQRLFRMALGTTVLGHARALRLNRARLQLEREGLSITQVAFAAGYSSPANFATAFRRRFSIAPKEVRRRS
jgi:AraC-like DNA-binding protein